MGPGGITVVLAMYWLNGGVEAVSLSTGDQYSPYQPPYRTNLAQGPLSYPNWLKYHQDLTTRLEPPDYTSGSRKADVNYVSKDRATQEDSLIPDLDILPFVPGEWKVTGYADVRINSNESAAKNLRNLKLPKRLSISNDDDFSEDTFQDQGPGSVEVYKLDLHRESPLIVPHDEKQAGKGSRMKSKIPKKAMAEEILWKLKPMDVNESQLPAIFRQPPLVIKDVKPSQESRHKVKTYHNDEAFAVGGVPELQVGCEGLETAERQKRSKGSDNDKMDKNDDWDNVGKYQEPVYRESTEPILFRVTPIVLNNDEEEPPSGEVYEEMDALMKLKKSESTSPKPTTRRWNRADIDPALEMDKYQEKRTEVETFPERGDLGPTSNSSEVMKSSDPETLNQREATGRFRRDTAPADLTGSFVSSFKDTEDTARSSLNQIRKENHRSGRKILWVQYSDGQGHDKPATSSRYHKVDNEHEEDDSDLWGFGEEDGELSDIEDEPDMVKLREAEIEKRRREYERRKQEELYRRREGGKETHQPHPGSDNSKARNVNMEIEKIRKDYERQLEQQQKERQRMPAERSEWENARREEIERRRAEEMRRQQDKESRRKLEEEERRRDWNRRREEEERRRRLGNQQSHEDPPSSLVRIPSPDTRNMARGRQDADDAERKLQDYIERNRPVDLKNGGEHRRPDEKVPDNDGRRRYMEYQERRRKEEERRRQQVREHQRGHIEPSENNKQQRVEEDHERERQRDAMEEHRRRQHENERRRQLAEQQRQRENEERRRQIEEQRRRDRPDNRTMEEERRRRLEEERKLQEYVRRNQPVVVPKRNSSQASNTSRGSNSEEQRRTIEAARQWDRSRRPSVNRNDGRVHGPSAPTNIGQRYPQDDQEDMRQRQGRVEEEHLRESNRRRLEEEERRREAEYRRVESRRREEERKRLEQVRRLDESRRAQSAERNNPSHGYGSSHRQPGQVLDRDAEELRRRDPAGRTTDNAMRNQEVEWRRRSEERAAQQLEQQRERQRLENERNSRNNQHRRPHHEDTRPKTKQPSESVRGGYNEAEWRRREHARLNSLPVSARIILRSDGLSGKGGRTSSGATPSRPQQRLEPWIGTRGSFDDDNDGFRQGLSPHRPGIEAVGFRVRSTSRPPVESPGACVWAIVQCCPSNKRRTACFESMGCPGAHWDPNPCSSSLTDAARDEVVKFYAAADRRNTRN